MRRYESPRITPGLALLPVRLFLGVTFVYAGYQKLSDPGFLHPGSATYIGTQLHAFANGTPGGFLLRWFAIPQPRVAGVGVALAEIVIGLLTLAGVLTRAAAAAGLALNLVLFLTASWTTTPYFLGPDIVYCFAWLPLVLVGSADQPAVVSPDLDPQTRRELLSRALAVTGVATVAIALVATLRKGPVGANRTAASLGGLAATPLLGHHNQLQIDAATGPAPAGRCGQAGIVLTGSGQLGGDLQGPVQWRSRHRHPPSERLAVGVQRGLHTHRLHGRVSVGSDRVPVPRVRVRPQHRGGAARSGRNAAPRQARARAARVDLRGVTRGQSPVELRHEYVNENGGGLSPVYGWIFSPALSMATYFAIRRARVSGRRASWIRYRIA